MAFHIGDIVWGKMRFCSWWPAIVLDPSDCGIKNTSPNKYALFWFGDYTISQVKKEKISPFKEKFQKWSKSERVKEAVNEALSVLATANDLTFDNVSALIKWADTGFPTTLNWEVKFQWTKPDLPQLIQKTLPKITKAVADENDEKDDVKKTISKVLKKEKSLEEICIGCCKENATLVQSHPLFLGKVCIKCTKDVNRANSLPCGSYQKYCIVCGQGGRLVYCSKKMCSRAFCKECIDYLDSEDTFTKITSLDDWLCYICNPIKKEDCLIIRRRAKKRKIESPVNDSLPVSKSARRDHSSSKIDCVITAVINGIKDLDDVCIACCKESVELICDHPLFKGKICKKCKKDVMKVCNLPCGKFYNFCIVCGQGGSIVYCSNDICSRAFCNVCIEYLDSEEAFAKITSLAKWPCYLCEPVKRSACLIRKRTMEQGIKNTASNQIPLSKSVNKKNQNAPNQVLVAKSMKKDVKNSAAFQIPDSKFMKQKVKKAPNLVPVSKSVKQEQNTTPNQIPVYKSVKQKVKNAASNQIPVSKSMKQKTKNTALNEVPASKSAHRARSSSSLGDVIFKLVTGRKNLEEVCIACCREDVELLCNHPLFIGKICKRCHKDVMKICSQPFGKYQDFCIICGQGGSLVYCSNDGCLRAYCQPCIEYLDCRNNSYEEIVEADSWSCYLCKPNLKKNCLIRKREIHEGFIDTPPTSPDAKFSENSFDSDEIVSAPDIAPNDGQFAISTAFPAAAETSTAFDNAFHDGENVILDTSASGKTEEPSDSAVKNELMDYSIESSYDSSVEDKAFEICLAATSKKSSSGKASAIDNVVEDKASGNCFAATSSKTSSTKKGRSSTSIVLSEIRAGKRYLEDICLSCRKIDVEIFTNHPWFIGGICPHCLTALAIFKDLEPDQRRNFCAICGQESSSFLCCSYKDCSRAYCKICVEYLDSKEAFAINAMDKNWICYLSEAYKKYSFKEDQLLIKQTSLVKHRKYRTRKDRSRLSDLTEVEGDLKKNVQKGAVKIEDICIACCKSEYELMEKSHIDLVVHHPLFFGSICESCVHDVATACKLPYGKKQNVCIICGKHESLVHCSNEECSRAYCQKCIEHLDSELALKKALKNTYWECYLCEFSRNEKCIIRRRFPPDNYAYDCEERLAVYTPEQSTDINKKKLWKGELTLKDVCIACLDRLTDYPMPHPLFKGKVCLKCFNEVHKVCNLSSGTMHDQCVLCSQGGKLVYCSNQPCQRAYCKLCIKCLDKEEAYPKIVQIKKWYCYYCNLHPSSRSFIQRKAIHMKGIKNFPEVPKIDDRSPINVLATNDRGQHALRKAKIEVDRYDYNRPSSSVGEESVLYDLVLGSFFVEDYQKPKEKLLEDFFRNFTQFNNRRIDCGFHHNIFFIFIADYILMDADILCEVAEKIHAQRQFHKIRPVLFQFGERKFLAWSNLSFCMSSAMDKINAGPYIDKHWINAGRYSDNETVEKEIYYSFVKYLKNYFKAKD